MTESSNNFHAVKVSLLTHILRDATRLFIGIVTRCRRASVLPPGADAIYTGSHAKEVK